MPVTEKPGFDNTAQEGRLIVVTSAIRRLAPDWAIHANRAWIFLPVLLAFALCLCFVPYVGIMPGSDYWGVLAQLVGNHGLHITVHGLYAQDNEHIIAVPKLVYAANVLLTNGNNKALTAIACCMSLMVGLILARALQRTLCAQASLHAIPLLLAFGIIAGGAAFTPLAMHNFFEGMSGVAWICTNLLVVTALYLQFARPKSTGILTAAVILTVLAAQSYSTGVPALVLLGLQMAFQRDCRRRGLVVIACGVALLAAVYFHQTVPEANGHHVFSLPLLGVFEALFLGSGLTTHPELAFVWGLMGAAMFVWLTISTFWRRWSLSPAQAFWVTLGGYAITAGLMAGIGRVSAFGLSDAISSRYATLPSLFWVALAGLLLTSKKFPKDEAFRRRALVVALVGCVAFVTMVASSHSGLMASFARVVYRPGATLSVFVGANDMKRIHDTITPAPKQLTKLRDTLQAMGHIPFNGYYDLCPALGSHLSRDRANQSVKGYIDSGSRIDGNKAFIKLHGWAAHKDGSSFASLFGKPQCIAIVDPAGTVEGLGIAGLPRPDVATALRSNDSGFGWIGYARLPDAGSYLMAFARQRNGRWAPLGQVAHVRQNAVDVH